MTLTDEERILLTLPRGYRLVFPEAGVSVILTGPLKPNANSGQARIYKTQDTSWYVRVLPADEFEREARALEIMQLARDSCGMDTPWVLGMVEKDGRVHQLLQAVPQGRTYLQWAAVQPGTAGLKPVMRVVDGIGRLHAAGFVHGDLKDGNLLWSEAEHRLIVIDWSSACPRGGDLAFHTPRWTPPSVQLSGRARARLDLFALKSMAALVLLGHQDTRNLQEAQASPVFRHLDQARSARHLARLLQGLCEVEVCPRPARAPVPVRSAPPRLLKPFVVAFSIAFSAFVLGSIFR